METSKQRIYKGLMEIKAKSRFNDIDTVNLNLEEVFRENFKGSGLKEKYFIEEEIALLNILNRKDLLPNGERERFDLYFKYLTEKETTPSNKNEKYLNENWFQVGLLFATGEMDQLLKQFNRNTTQIAKHLKPEKPNSIRSYISESLSKTNDSDKNIFSRPDKVLKIQRYCTDQNIEMIEHFKNLKQPI